MSAKHDGGPAFPYSIHEDMNLSEVCRGITKRDWFAAMAMNGIFSNPETVRHGQDSPSNVCQIAYEIADEMLKARER